jgi:hypothetical protein
LGVLLLVASELVVAALALPDVARTTNPSKAADAAVRSVPVASRSGHHVSVPPVIAGAVLLKLPGRAALRIATAAVIPLALLVIARPALSTPLLLVDPEAVELSVPSSTNTALELLAAAAVDARTSLAVRLAEAPEIPAAVLDS